MSLINDALKKAQNRHGDTSPPTIASNGPAAIPAAPRKGRTPLGKLIVAAAVLSLFSATVSAVLIFFVMRETETPAPPPSSPPVAKPSAPSPVVAHPATVATAPQTTAASQPAPAISPSPAVIAPAAPVVTSVPPTTPPITPAPSAAENPVGVPEPEPAPAIKLGTRIQAFVDRLRVTSIRISDTGNKAILNDRLFRVNDLVEPSLGLRLTEIQPRLLIFTDENGDVYQRHF